MGGEAGMADVTRPALALPLQRWGLSLQGEREGFLGQVEQRRNDPRPHVRISSHLLGLCFCVESSKEVYENHTQEVNCRN